VRLIRGSHIVLPALYQGEQAYILQNDDRRVFFVIPYEGRFSLVGTTDVPHEGDPRQARCTEEEADYLCAAVGRQFRRAPDPTEIVWSYSGVRPLHDDGAHNPSAVTRDYVLKVDNGPDRPPLLTIYGGKITTYRRLAEEAVGRICAALGRAGTPWTGNAALPGGDLGGMALPQFEAEMARRHPWLAPCTVRRLARAYGGDLEALLDGAGGPDAMGEEYGAGFTERELDWLIRREWARTAEDVLWRRSKLGLHMPPEGQERLARRLDGINSLARAS
jgi:glycerol-3-phosphate dehydrogenase